jgi:bacterioferritin (cytochrome b1)
MKGNEKIAERLIARILFLEGRPIVSQLGAVAIEGQRDQIMQMGIATYLGQQI